MTFYPNKYYLPKSLNQFLSDFYTIAFILWLLTMYPELWKIQSTNCSWHVIELVRSPVSRVKDGCPKYNSLLYLASAIQLRSSQCSCNCMACVFHIKPHKLGQFDISGSGKLVPVFILIQISFVFCVNHDYRHSKFLFMKL